MFKIDKLGFYKNQKGEKVEIVRDWLWLDTEGRHYYTNGERATLDETIVAKWTKQEELEEFAHETDCASRERFYAVTSNASNTGILFTYDTLEQAKEGAKSLAKYEPSTKFYILETIAYYTAEVEIKEIKI